LQHLLPIALGLTEIYQTQKGKRGIFSLVFFGKFFLRISAKTDQLLASVLFLATLLLLASLLLLVSLLLQIFVLLFTSVVFLLSLRLSTRLLPIF
jgi:hypothetical protein